MEASDKSKIPKMDLEQKNDSIFLPQKKISDSDPIVNFRKLQDEYKSQLLSLKKQLTTNQKKNINLFKSKYETFILEIGTFLKSESEKINNLVEKGAAKDFTNTYTSSIIDKVKSIINLQSKIQESIYQNYTLLINLLELNSKFFSESKNPDQLFFKKNSDLFIQSWSLSKVDLFDNNNNDKINSNVSPLIDTNVNPFIYTIFTKFNQNINNEFIIPQSLKNFFSTFPGLNQKEMVKNYVDFDLVSPQDCTNESKKTFLMENTENLHQLNLKNISTNDFYNIFPKKENIEAQTEESKTYSSLNKLTIKDCKFENILFYDYFKNISSLLIKSSKINISNIFSNNDDYSKLKEITFNNLNITTRTLDKIIQFFNMNPMLLKNLQIFSLANNLITKVSLYNEVEETTGVFENLVEFNLENNKVYKYDPSNFNVTPRIKLINLINNNLAFNEAYITIKDNMKSLEKQKEQIAESEGYVYKRKKNLVLVAKNLFVLKGDERNEYVNYLFSVLPEFDYPLKELTLETLFNLNNKESLCNIKLHSLICQNLLYINISMCSLDNEDLTKFLLENVVNFSNVKKINAGFNYIDEKFFDLFVSRMEDKNKKNKNSNELEGEKKNENNEVKLFNNVEKIDFSGNEKIFFKNNYKGLIQFGNCFPKLKKFEMSRTNFETLIGVFLKYKLREVNMKEGTKVAMSTNMKNNYEEIDSFNKDYYQLNKGNYVFRMRELISKQKYEKVFSIATSQLKMFSFKYKNNASVEKN